MADLVGSHFEPSRFAIVQHFRCFRIGLGSIVVSARHVFAFRLRIPTHGVAFFESDFMIALGPRQGNIAPLCSAVIRVRDYSVDLESRCAVWHD